MANKTDEQIFAEYCELMDFCHIDSLFKLAFLNVIHRAREEEPRINCGTHFIDWMNIVDDDDTFDSFYGEDYFD